MVLEPGDRLRLEGMVAFVTGGSSGIGAAVASLLTQRGARVAVASPAASAITGTVLAVDGGMHGLRMPGSSGR